MRTDSTELSSSLMNLSSFSPHPATPPRPATPVPGGLSASPRGSFVPFHAGSPCLLLCNESFSRWPTGGMRFGGSRSGVPGPRGQLHPGNARTRPGHRTGTGGGWRDCCHPRASFPTWVAPGQTRSSGLGCILDGSQRCPNTVLRLISGVCQFPSSHRHRTSSRRRLSPREVAPRFQ